MARKTSLVFALLVGLLVALALTGMTACGGSSDSPPKPLSRHFDDMFIAQIPLEQKQAVVTAQNDYSVAKMEHAKAQADLSEANAGVEIAKNDRKSTENTLNSALTTKKQADTSADQTRVNDAARELRGAELAKKAAEKRVKYMEVYRDWLKKHARYTEENLYWREAQFEVAKADIAQKNNIAPKDFKFADYPQQESERKSRASKARESSEKERGKASEARQGWLRQQAESDQANGRSSDLPDPMAKLSSSTPSS
jgi:hypothetical protein